MPNISSTQICIDILKINKQNKNNTTTLAELNFCDRGWCFSSWKHMLPIFWNIYLIYFKMLKNWNEKFACTCSRATCPQSLHDKSTYHVTCVKKIKYNAKNKAFHMTIFIFFTYTIKHISFWQNFINALRLWICKCKKFGQFF
jgi:hypothetical protein